MTPTGRLFLAKPSLKLKFFDTPFAVFQFWCSPNTSHTKHAIYFIYSISLLLVSSYGNQALDGSEFACFVCAVLLFFIGFIVWSFRCKLCAGKNTWLVYLPVLSTHLYCLHKSMDECRDSVRLLDVDLSWRLQGNSVTSLVSFLPTTTRTPLSVVGQRGGATALTDTLRNSCPELAALTALR